MTCPLSGGAPRDPECLCALVGEGEVKVKFCGHLAARQSVAIRKSVAARQPIVPARVAKRDRKQTQNEQQGAGA